MNQWKQSTLTHAVYPRRYPWQLWRPRKITLYLTFCYKVDESGVMLADTKMEARVEWRNR